MKGNSKYARLYLKQMVQNPLKRSSGCPERNWREPRPSERSKRKGGKGETKKDEEGKQWHHHRFASRDIKLVRPPHEVDSAHEKLISPDKYEESGATWDSAHEMRIGSPLVRRGHKAKRNDTIRENTRDCGLGTCWFALAKSRHSEDFCKTCQRSGQKSLWKRMGADTVLMDVTLGFFFSIETHRMRQFSKTCICLQENPG